MSEVASLVTEVREEIFENASAVGTQFWKDNEIRTHLWNGETILADKGNFPEFKTTIATVTAQSSYSVPTNVLNTQRLTFQGFPLVKINLLEYDQVSNPTPGFTPQSGQPVYYLEFNEEYTIFPTPITSALTLDVFAGKRPVVLTTATTNFTIPEQFQHYLKDYALYRMTVKDDEKRAGAYFTTWNSGIVEAERQWREKKDLGADLVVRRTDLDFDITTPFFLT